jgi:lambda family phage minor tail protein L
MTSLNQLTQQDVLPSYIELFELDMSRIGGGVYRFTNCVNSAGYVTFGGESYTLLPIEFSGLTRKSDGSQPRCELKVSNINKILLGEIVALGDIVGARLTRIQTFACYLDSGETPDPTQCIKDVFYISQKTAQSPTYINFELCSALELTKLMIPGRVATKSIFPSLGGSTYR